MNNNKKWTAADIGDLTDKIVIVTGANSGIGLEAAKVLTAKGAHVVMASRSVARATEAQRELSGSSEVAELDLASLASVHSFADTFKKRHNRLDILINNAGVMAIPYRKTADGFEMQFGTNHLGHFALTGHLIDLLLAADQGRVVTVSSVAHTRGVMDWDNVAGENENTYSEWDAYGMSKLSNLLFAYELQRKFDQHETNARSIPCHPGYAATNLQSIEPERLVMRFFNALMKVTNRVIAQSAEMGALPTLYAAVADDAYGGTYIGPKGNMRGYPVPVESNDKSHSLEDAAKLWEISTELTGVTYDALLS